MDLEYIFEQRNDFEVKSLKLIKINTINVLC